MWSRREFLTRTSSGAAAVVASFDAGGLPRLLEATAGVAQRAVDDVARDETYWREVRRAFTFDPTIINLNNGGCSPSPRVVHEAFKGYLDVSNQAPSYFMWEVLEPKIEDVRRALAADVGADPETIAITRNTTEALHIAQMGLDLRRGDHVVTTTHDYPRMLGAWDQRARREGIEVTKLSFPVPPSAADIVRRFEAAITPATKVLHFCHITNLTGHIFPVRELCDLARRRGLISIVDGAHAYAHFPFTLTDFDPDYYGTSLHKWLLAPIGTGFLYMRKERIADHWALHPPPGGTTIRKFEEVGTHPAANHNAIIEALAFHQGIGVARKAARLRYLKDRWAQRLKDRPRFRLFTSLDSSQSCALGTIGIEGTPAYDISSALWKNHRILVPPIDHADFHGIRATPNVYTTIEEIDRFGDAMEAIGR